MTRNVHLPKNARKTSFSLTPPEELAIDIIQKSRRSGSVVEKRKDSPSEIVADAIWYYLKEKYGKTQEQVEAMLPAVPKLKEDEQSNLKQFPKKKKGNDVV